MHFLPALALATFATGVVAKKIPSPGWDKYAEERGFAGYEDPREMGHGGLHAREADAEAEASWSHAHGGKALSYKPYGEHEGYEQHHARAAEPSFHGNRYGHGVQDFHHEKQHHAREVPDFGGLEVDTSLAGYVVERSAPEHFGHAHEAQHHGGHHARDIPDFDGEDVDTSLAGYVLHARDVPDFDEEDVDTSLEGLDLHARDVPDFGDEEVDTSLAGYVLHTRDVPEFDEEDVDTSLEGLDLHARDIPDFGGEDVDISLEGYVLHARDVPEFDDEEDVDASLEGYSLYAREAEAEARMPYKHASPAQPFHRPHHAREAEAEAEPAFNWEEEAHKHSSHMAKTTHGVAPQGWRVHARDPANTHHAAHPTEVHGWPAEAKHTASKTAAPKKSGGWGFPW
ncbi:hypothetical protein LTR56_005829 [Elasticomyces elasticus]|nr:hypothetical protein LTR22_019414 [Elasticomyces elasticus]KAK3651372.1 hypothetical protein LTR56_005829 [Elasticomyces elasticus]KAK4925760.1 hypothetical protein LTR49_007370 [Elasticomyces elasticus]KAK5765092.1 hypothetical protein LTS12_004870 [Elasticomyces elasticus]